MIHDISHKDAVTNHKGAIRFIQRHSREIVVQSRYHKVISPLREAAQAL